METIDKVLLIVLLLSAIGYASMISSNAPKHYNESFRVQVTR